MDSPPSPAPVAHSGREVNIDGCPLCPGEASESATLLAQEALCGQIRALLLQHQQALDQRVNDWMASQQRLLQQACGCPVPFASCTHALERKATSGRVSEHAGAEQISESECGTDHGPFTGPQFSQLGTKQSLNTEEELRQEISTCKFGTEDDGPTGAPRIPATPHSLDTIEKEDELRQHCARRQSTVKSFARSRSSKRTKRESRMGRLAALMASPGVELLSALLICTNSIAIGVEVEYMARSLGDPVPGAFFLINTVYTLVFAPELLLRMVAQRWAFCTSSDWRWNIVDLTVVLASLVEVAMELTSLWEGAATSNVRIIRILRVARLSRTMRIPRIFRIFGALRTLIYSICDTLRSLVWTLVLLALLMYAFAIVFTQFAIDSLAESQAKDPALATYWGSLDKSALTLFKSISGGLSWHDVAAPLRDINQSLEWLFSLYIFFTTFAMLNVVTGIFCNTAIENAANDLELVADSLVSKKKENIQKIRDLFKSVGGEESSLITIGDLEDSLSSDTLKAYFTALGIDTDDAWGLFKLLDTDQTNTVDIEEFVWGCMRLRGAAKAADLSALMDSNNRLTKRVSKLARYVEWQFKELGRALRPAAAAESRHAPAAAAAGRDGQQ